MPDIPDSQRMTGLEERLTYQQHLIDQLNKVVLTQGKELEQLRRDVQQYTTAVQRMAQQPGEDLPHEKPPHY